MECVHSKPIARPNHETAHFDAMMCRRSFSQHTHTHTYACSLSLCVWMFVGQQRKPTEIIDEVDDVKYTSMYRPHLYISSNDSSFISHRLVRALLHVMLHFGFRAHSIALLAYRISVIGRCSFCAGGRNSFCCCCCFCSVSLSLSKVPLFLLSLLVKIVCCTPVSTRSMPIWLNSLIWGWNRNFGSFSSLAHLARLKTSFI